MNRMTDEELQAVIQETYTPIYMTTKEGLVQYYQQKYGDGWIPEISRALQGTIFNRKGEAVSTRNISRRFQGKQLAKGQGHRAEYETLGKKLPPVGFIKPSKVKVSFRGSIKVSKNWAKCSFSRVFPRKQFEEGLTFGDLFSAYFAPDPSPVIDRNVQSLTIKSVE